MLRTKGRPWAAGSAALAVVCVSCGTQPSNEPKLSKQAPGHQAAPAVPAVSADGPRLGSVANVTPVLELPAKHGKIIGYLHGGATVPRAKEAYSKEGCAGGWYPVHPRGFVCVGQSASLDLKHPTLAAMAMTPKLDGELPYTYARMHRDAPTYEANSEREGLIRHLNITPSRSGLAVIGSWNANDEQGVAHRLAMMTDGRFVDAADLEANRASEFSGIAIDEKQPLPVAFVVKQGVRSWALTRQEASKAEALGYHALLELDGKSRTVQGERFWALRDGRWVRHRDVTVIQARAQFPQFVNDASRWIDVSVLTGTAVLYEGKKPVYATLVSVGRDRLGDPNSSEATVRGEFPIVFKHVTAVAVDPKQFANQVEMHDVPWALELASGQWLHAAYWHDRFGIEHGPGNIQLAPKDAAHIWRWAGPALPEGWHGVAAQAEQPTLVNIRK